jgi:hypothetical protein
MVPEVTLSGPALHGVEPDLIGPSLLASLPARVKLGRIRLPARPAVLGIGAYLDRGAMKAPPASTNWRDKAAASLSRMYLNDQEGDCHDAETEVLTDTGWQKWPDYDGALLGTMNRQTGMLEFQAPIALVRREYEGPMAYTSHKGLDFALTPGHRIYFRRYKIPYPYVKGGAHYGGLEFGVVGDLPTRCMLPGAPVGFVGAGIRKVEIAGRVWDGDELIRLLAIIISDGYVSNGETNRNRVGFCCFREDRRDMVASLAHRLGIAETGRRGVWEMRDWGLARWLRANIYDGGGYGSRHKMVPDLVKVAEQRQIEEFLRYFGDQHVSDHGGRVFYSSSRRLIDDLQELTLRVGKRASIHSREARPAHFGSDGREYRDNGPSYTLHEAEHSDVVLQRLGRLNKTVEFDHYKGEVFCATVPNSTLITRRNGRVLVSSNCVIASKMHALGVWSGNESGNVVLATDQEVHQQYQGICGPGDNGCIITAVLDVMRSRGLQAGGKLYKIDGYVACDWTDALQVKVAIAIFGASTIGINLPEAWTRDAVWDVTNTKIVGGHDVSPIDFDQDGVFVSSWGRVYKITWRAFTSRVWLEEMYVMLAPLWYEKDQVAPSGIRVETLKADLAKIGRGETPDVGPSPPPGPGPGPTPAPRPLFHVTVPWVIQRGGQMRYLVPVRTPAGEYDFVPSSHKATEAAGTFPGWHQVWLLAEQMLHAVGPAAVPVLEGWLASADVPIYVKDGLKALIEQVIGGGVKAYE